MSSASSQQHEPDWNNAPDFGRRETLLYTTRRSHQLCDQPPVIVEIGTSRDERPEACNGDGWSTRAWGWYAQQQQRAASNQQHAARNEERKLGRVYTVDIDPQAIEACKRITAAQADAIEYVVSDSLEFLRNWNVEESGKIDLLYLDGLDYFDPVTSEDHMLLEAQAALTLMAERCLVLFDDTTPSEEQGPPPPFIRYAAGEGTRTEDQGHRTQDRAKPLDLQGVRVEKDTPAVLLTSPHLTSPTGGEERGHPQPGGSATSPVPLTPPHLTSPTEGRGTDARTDARLPVFTGKGARAIPFLLDSGFVVEFDCGGQVLLSRGAEDIAPEIGHDRVSTLITERLQAYARRHWLDMPALCTIGGGYRVFEATAEAQVYLDTVARLCDRLGDIGTGRRGEVGSALEVGPTSAYAQAYLAKRGVCASAVLFENALIERARQAAHWLGCDAEFTVGGLFSLDADTARKNAEDTFSREDANTQKDAEEMTSRGDAETRSEEDSSHKNAQKGTAHKATKPQTAENRDRRSAQKKQNRTEEATVGSVLPNTQDRTPNTDALSFPSTQSPAPSPYRVIFHSNLAASLPTPWLLTMLAQQVALANWVVFSVDSVFAEQNAELDELGCRRLTPEMWQELLSDFEIGDLRTYGPTGKERILITLRGRFLRWVHSRFVGNPGRKEYCHPMTL